MINGGTVASLGYALTTNCAEVTPRIAPPPLRSRCLLGGDYNTCMTQVSNSEPPAVGDQPAWPPG